jgi:hypothetical protein
MECGYLTYAEIEEIIERGEEELFVMTRPRIMSSYIKAC